MRHFWIALGLLLILPCTAALGQTGAPSYQVTFGAKNLGMWNTVKQGRSKIGMYDGVSFDSSTGPGFVTVTLSRTLTDADKKGLWVAIGGDSSRLVIRTMRGGTAVLVTTCAKAIRSTLEASGDPGHAMTTLAFACTTIATTKPKS